MAGGTVGGFVAGANDCGFGTSLASGAAGSAAGFVTSASITGDWSAKGFALSVGSSVAGAAAGFGLGMLCFVRGTQVTKADGSTEPIEEVALGERVLPTSAACEAVDVSDWRRYDFVVEGREPDQSDALSVALLRPEGWHPELATGGRLWLDLEELGIHGWGRLAAVSEVEDVEDGPGCPVTGTFTGRNDSVMTLYLEGEDKPLELTTEGHRLYSATRGAWVQAVKLAIGEELQTLDGVVAVAGRVVEHERVERVFNLEVFDKHAYHVGRLGGLAHNQRAGGMCSMDQNMSYDDPAEVAGETNMSVAPEPKRKIFLRDDGGAALKDAAAWYGLEYKERSGMFDGPDIEGLLDRFIEAGTGAQMTLEKRFGNTLKKGIAEKLYPPNRGFHGKPERIALTPGTRIDRYGAPSGTFTSPAGTPFPERSLPSAAASKPLNTYEVVKPFEVHAGPAEPWFGQPGMGTQYESRVSVQRLIDEGFLREVPGG